MTPKKTRPYLFNPGGKGSRGTYVPEEPEPRVEPDDAKPKLVGDTVSCRHEISKVGGVVKYCPYERARNSKYCRKHKK